MPNQMEKKMMRPILIAFLAMTLAGPALAQGAPLSLAVPTTKILAISHPMGAPITAEQRATIMPHEVRDTVAAYLSGKIDQWYVQSNGRGVVFRLYPGT